MMKHWIFDVVACSDGTEVSAKAARKLKEYCIPLHSEPIRSLEGADGKLKSIQFDNGKALVRSGLFFFDRLPSGVRLIKKSWLQAE